MQRNEVSVSPALLASLKKLFLFRNISDDVLRLCLPKAEEIHLLKDELIFKKGEPYHKGIYFVVTGIIRLFTPSEDMNVSAGDAVGITTFLGKTMYTVTAEAFVDSDILFVSEQSIYKLMDKGQEFREKFMHIIVDRLNNLDQLSTRTVSLSAYQSVGACMSSPLITLHQSKSVAYAAQVMQEHNIGAVVIMNRKHVIKGLLTAKQLAHKYLANASALPGDAMAEDYANINPLMLPQEYPIVETLAEMLRHGEDYALVTRKHRPVGIISKTDIVGLLANGSDVFAAGAARSENAAELKSMLGTLPKILENMMNNTAIFREILPSLSSNHLIIQKRVFELAKQDYKKLTGFELKAGKFCVSSIGDLARREFTLKLTQSHIIIVNDSVAEEELEHYRAFAKLFSGKLRELGYQTSGGLHLGNPNMVKRISDWSEFLSGLSYKSGEEPLGITRRLLDSDKFEGDEMLQWEYKDRVQQAAKERLSFLNRLVDYQKTKKIPVSQFGAFITQRDGAYAGSMDLKEGALSFITYTAQALSLSANILDINTVRRLEHLERKNIISQELSRTVIAAYESIVSILLHEQLSKVGEGQEASYMITPSILSMYAAERLKRAFHATAGFFGEALKYFNQKKTPPTD